METKQTDQLVIIPEQQCTTCNGKAIVLRIYKGKQHTQAVIAQYWCPKCHHYKGC